MLYRNTYMKVYLDNIKYNVEQIIKQHSNYKYYFGVVKADCYGHYSNKVVNKIIEGGCNYLAVSSLEEALIIRKNFKQIPILCLGIIDERFIDICEKNNITITISNLEYLKKIENKATNIKVHIKLDTGMHRLGMNDKNEINEVYNRIINSNNIYLEGIYSHIYEANNKKNTERQINKFIDFTKDLKDIPIIHLFASESIMLYDKLDFINGCRLGLIMYGFGNNLKSTFKLISEVIQINKLNKNETLGYNGIYKASKDELIAVIPIGYADGIIRANTGRYVYINDKKYEIVGNICMDMLFVKVDSSVHVKDKVEIIKDVNHIKEIAKHLNTIEYEIICNIGKRVPRIYI